MQKRTRDEIISSGLTKPTAIYPITILRGFPVPGSVGVTNMHESQSDFTCFSFELPQRFTTNFTYYARSN